MIHWKFRNSSFPLLVFDTACWRCRPLPIISIRHSSTSPPLLLETILHKVADHGGSLVIHILHQSLSCFAFLTGPPTIVSRLEYMEHKSNVEFHNVIIYHKAIHRYVCIHLSQAFFGLGNLIPTRIVCTLSTRYQPTADQIIPKQVEHSVKSWVSLFIIAQYAVSPESHHLSHLQYGARHHSFPPGWG